MSEASDPRVTPWHNDESDFYEIDSFRDQMAFLLRYAVLAPSTHNTQPWMFRITEAGVEFYPDYSRRLMIIDPFERELFMSLGAAIANFRIAAAHFGFETTAMYERGAEEAKPVAIIAVRETSLPDGKLQRLFSAIPQRRTNRHSFDAHEIDPDKLQAVCDLIDDYADTFQIVLPHDQQRLGAIVADADRELLSRRAFRSETAEWIRPNRGYSDGICSDALAAPWVIRHNASWQIAHDAELAVNAALLVVVAAEDDRVSLVRAGEALEELLLTITAAGLHYSFLNQPIIAGDFRQCVQLLAGTTRPAQLILRIGHATETTRALPRRDVAAVVTSSS